VRATHLFPLVALGVLTLVGAPNVSTAQSWHTKSLSRQYRGERHLTVSVEFASGSFTLQPTEGSALYRAELRYDEEHFDPVARYETASQELHLGVDADEIDRDFELSDESPQYLHVELSPAVPTELDLEFGIAKAQIDLGGLSLRRAAVKTGASESVVAFSVPNRVACDKFSVAVGAAEILVEGLGNARCDEITVVGGAGAMTLDFTGAWQQEAMTRAVLTVGLGTVTLRLPENLGVALDLDRLFVGFEANGFTKRGDRFVSAHAEDAEPALFLHIRAALGEIRVEWVSPESGT
jgi:hypothetical protein